jgi:HD superfamily phosphohydrolase
MQLFHRLYLKIIFYNRTAHLAYRLIRKLRECQPELNIDDRDVLSVTIAALCHDIGNYRYVFIIETYFRPWTIFAFI